MDKSISVIMFSTRTLNVKKLDRRIWAVENKEKENKEERGREEKRGREEGRKRNKGRVEKEVC